MKTALAAALGIIAGLATLAMTSKPAFAATKQQEKSGEVYVQKLENGPDINLSVPESQIDLRMTEMAPEPKKQLHFEALASFWNPQGVSQSSDIDGGDYNSNGTPQISLNMWGDPTWNLGQVAKIMPKYGIAFEQLGRTANYSLGGATGSASQVLNLYSIRLGAEITPQTDYWNHVRPFASLSLLPTWAQSPQSVFNDGQSQIELGLEEILGVSYQSARVGQFIGAQSVGLEIGLQATEGLVGSLNGFGFLAGTRVEL